MLRKLSVILIRIRAQAKFDSEMFEAKQILKNVHKNSDFVHLFSLEDVMTAGSGSGSTKINTVSKNVAGQKETTRKQGGKGIKIIWSAGGGQN